MRTERCPICGTESPAILELHFNQKMNLPTVVPIRCCVSDNFLFVATGDQHSYDEYYRAFANDSYHSEVASDNLHSPIAQLQREHMLKLLGDFFQNPRKVLDFGCGEAWLLAELALQFRSSTFWGFDPSPAALSGLHRANALGLTNLRIAREASNVTACDLIIVSHVLEHLIEFSLVRSWHSALAKDGLLYVEVPNALKYSTHERTEFLYYFDRLHVNHFTPESMSKLMAQHGFGYVGHFEYEFPYRDGKPYPALGVLFRKGGGVTDIDSPSVVESGICYISAERQRAQVFREKLKTFDGLLVWGAGDNFYRSSENGGPLCDLPNMVVLDRCPQIIALGLRQWTTEIPADAIRRHSWPVVITISGGRQTIGLEVKKIDSSRQIFFI